MKARIAQVANNNQLPGIDSFTFPAVMNTSSFLSVGLIGERRLYLVGSGA